MEVVDITPFTFEVITPLFAEILLEEIIDEVDIIPFTILVN